MAAIDKKFSNKINLSIMKYLKLVLTPLFYCFLLSSCSKDIEVNKEDFSRFYPDEQPEPDPEPDPDPGANDFPASIVWEFTTEYSSSKY
ncbi:hypothetical protein LZ575_14305 [Antarcticibacterium sp. 1MA-6-2]|uniref:hypothetical protein n=1 Tax=Antarcticibacterium sp. 1MA-6-2 TaxID=2908210 RepID=UPI001F289874|nr:hypothetical protein [Antarcticibacterium sp. 1MA-6-2]UJH90083.1 hypothetical protein LZ575_14305 [Antarcticibacterium sp. 1MA-6-2]